MERKIIIEAGEVAGKAVLFESEIAKKIWDLLPIEYTCNTWDIGGP